MRSVHRQKGLDFATKKRGKLFLSCDDALDEAVSGLWTQQESANTSGITGTLESASLIDAISVFSVFNITTIQLTDSKASLAVLLRLQTQQFTASFKTCKSDLVGYKKVSMLKVHLRVYCTLFQCVVTCSVALQLH